jgi:NAD(P)-dependent dehydrogenase (short-subunit alcohol dehydrogenase family)
MTADTPLADKIALVTGASRGIGRASALALAGAGAQVVATARTQGALESLDDEIFALTRHHATLVPLDLAEPAGLDALGLALHQRFGRLDVLVHAGAVLGAITPVSHVEPGLWDRVMTVRPDAYGRLIFTVVVVPSPRDMPPVANGVLGLMGSVMPAPFQSGRRPAPRWHHVQPIG